MILRFLVSDTPWGWDFLHMEIVPFIILIIVLSLIISTLIYLTNDAFDNWLFDIEPTSYYKGAFITLLIIFVIFQGVVAFLLNVAWSVVYLFATMHWTLKILELAALFLVPKLLEEKLDVPYKGGFAIMIVLITVFSYLYYFVF